jgi:hypothetical protein
VAPPTATSTSTAAATSTSPRRLRAASETFVWNAAPGAAAYEFQLFRGAERIFRARVDEPRLELQGSWRQGGDHGGRTESMTPGTYRWYVWAISRKTNRRADVAIVQARLVVEKPPQ